MDQEYTAEDVAIAAKLFTQAMDKDPLNEKVLWEVSQTIEWDSKEMNRLFKKYLFRRGTNQHDVADAMDETLVRLAGYSFDTYLFNTFLRSEFRLTEEK